MATRDYGDMPLGTKPMLPQFAQSMADQKPRPKTQTFRFSDSGPVCSNAADDEDREADARKHIVDRADAMRKQPVAAREAAIMARTARTSPLGRTGAFVVSGDLAGLAAALNSGPRSRMALVSTTRRLPTAQAAGLGAAAAAGGTTTTSSSSSSALNVPAAVLAEKQVLRFFAWFREAVPESRMETTRVRRVTINYELEKGHLSVFEPRTHNSGLLQGPVVRKGRVVKGVAEDGSPVYITEQDLSVAQDLTIHGRTYRVYDADGFTREWYAARGAPLAAAEEPPEDVFAALQRAQAAASSDPARFRKRLYAEKVFQEARLGKAIMDPEARRKFQDNDGKLLRFDCLWSDAREAGDTLHYVLQWHLADDEAELLEVHPRNDGRDPTRVAVSKRRMPRDWHRVMTMPGDPSSEAAENWMTPMDLVVGSTVNVFGRDLRIRGADSFTRHWYRETHGFEQPPAQYKREVEPPPPRLPPPPHTGIGDPEDTMQSTKTFAPRPPRKDFDKWSRFESVVYRFKARIVEVGSAGLVPHHSDGHRRFTIALYPTDDTLSIFEPPLRNSGQSAGKFLLRGKHRTEGGRLFRPTDFRPGHTVIINTRLFRVDDADPFTRREVPEVDLPVPGDGRENMFPRGPTTTSADGTMKHVVLPDASSSSSSSSSSA